MKKGFTIVELTVVVIIVGILAAMVIPMMNAAAVDEDKIDAGNCANHRDHQWLAWEVIKTSTGEVFMDRNTWMYQIRTCEVCGFADQKAIQ